MDKLRIQNAKELIKFRESLGMSPKEMAKWFGISDRTYEGWEQGRKDKKGLHIYFVSQDDYVSIKATLSNLSKEK